MCADADIQRDINGAYNGGYIRKDRTGRQGPQGVHPLAYTHIDSGG